MLGEVYIKENDWVATLFWEVRLHLLKVTIQWKCEQVTAMNTEDTEKHLGSRYSFGIFLSEFLR